MSEEHGTVTDWATDYDIFDDEYVRDPAPIWDEIRGSGCPIAHTKRYGGSWLPTKYEQLQAMVRMVPELSSRSVTVVPPSPELRAELVEEVKQYGSESPPITSDPPEQIPLVCAAGDSPRAHPTKGPSAGSQWHRRTRQNRE